MIPYPEEVRNNYTERILRMKFKEFNMPCCGKGKCKKGKKGKKDKK